MAEMARKGGAHFRSDPQGENTHVDVVALVGRGQSSPSPLGRAAGPSVDSRRPPSKREDGGRAFRITNPVVRASSGVRIAAHLAIRCKAGSYCGASFSGDRLRLAWNCLCVAPQDANPGTVPQCHSTCSLGAFRNHSEKPSEATAAEIEEHEEAEQRERCRTATLSAIFASREVHLSQAVPQMDE